MADKQKELFKTLVRFYNKPVAKVSLELFFSILTIMFFSVFAIKPTLTTVARLITEIEEKKELEQQLQRKISALATAQEEYQLLQQEISLLDQAIPIKPELIHTLKVLEKKASQNNVIISSIRLAEIPEETKADTSKILNRIDLYLSVRVTGDYPSIRDFIASIHQYRRSLIVEEISFVVSDRIISQELQANLSIRMPYFGSQITKKNAK